MVQVHHFGKAREMRGKTCVTMVGVRIALHFVANAGYTDIESESKRST
jgi:hypothetical protein